MLYKISIFIGLLGMASTFWLYSRFTVDDAFITWRYGKNFIEHGIWNYSPSLLDLTQAYTNPIFAALSLLPPTLNIDMVLFFKFFSITNILVFAAWYLRSTKGSYFTLVLLLAMPASIVHAFGGLETFLYVSLMGALLVTLDKNNKGLAVGLTLALFLTRPESWALALLLPLFFLLRNDDRKMDTGNLRQRFIDNLKSSNFDFTGALVIAGALGIPLLFYLLFNLAYFQYALPNTFYAKSGAIFSINQFIKFLFFTAPVVLVLLYGRSKLFLFIAVYSCLLGVKYSISNLQMDYSSRFAFHIFIPIFIVLVYLSTTKTSELELVEDSNVIIKLDLETSTKLIAASFLLVFYKTSGIAEAGLVTYYPRALDAHAALGKTLSQIKEKYNLDSFALGDAGMTAYHSDMRALDNIGLGSALVTHMGLNTNVMESYSPDLIAFYARPSEGILKDYNQVEMLKWAYNNGLTYVCDVYWQPDYTLRLYSRIRARELEKVCEISKEKNDTNNRSYLRATWANPPWRYWTE